MYQTVVVGGGIAGLHTGIEIAKRGISCCIIDEYNCGGRIQTYYNSNLGVQWENGAGRISTKHKMVLHYLKKYGLTFVPISSEINYLSKILFMFMLIMSASIVLLNGFHGEWLMFYFRVVLLLSSIIPIKIAIRQNPPRDFRK